MPMIITPLSLAGRWFHPASAGDSGVAVFLRPLTAAEYSGIVQDVMRDLVASAQPGEPAPAVRATGRRVVRAAFEICVLDTRGIEIANPSGGSRRPASGGDLYEALAGAAVTHGALLDEIYTAILSGSEIDSETLGNSNAPPDSSTRQTKRAGARKNGSAQSVAGKARKQKSSTRKR